MVNLPATHETEFDKRHKLITLHMTKIKSKNKKEKKRSQSKRRTTPLFTIHRVSSDAEEDMMIDVCTDIMMMMMTE